HCETLVIVKRDENLFFTAIVCPISLRQLLSPGKNRRTSLLQIKTAQSNLLIEAEIHLLIGKTITIAPAFGLNCEIGWFLNFQDQTASSDGVGNTSGNQPYIILFCFHLL